MRKLLSRAIARAKPGRHLIAVVHAAGLALFVACTHVDPAAAPLAERNTLYKLPLNTVTFADPSLSRIVVAEQTGSKRSAANTLVAWTLLRNRTDDRMSLSIRTRFFDADKAPLDDTGWSPVFVDRRGLQTYEVPSTRSAAVYYNIEITQGR